MYLLGQRFCLWYVLKIAFTTSSPLRRTNFKMKHAQNLWPNKYLDHCKYSVVRKKETVLLSTSPAWPTWVGCSWAELFSQPGTNFLHNPVELIQPVNWRRVYVVEWTLAQEPLGVGHVPPGGGAAADVVLRRGDRHRRPAAGPPRQGTACSSIPCARFRLAMIKISISTPLCLQIMCQNKQRVISFKK